MSIDPEWQRYKRKYTTFPGIRTCIELIGRANVHGAYLDAVLYDLQKHAIENLDSLILAFHDEKDERVRTLILSVIAEARDERAFSTFQAAVFDRNEEVREWAVYGLFWLDTKEARRFLWETREHGFGSQQEQARFEEMVERARPSRAVRKNNAG